MPLRARAASLWRNLTRRQRVDDDLDAELRAAVDQLTDEHVQGGMAPDDARRAARLALGGVEPVKTAVRQARAGAGLDTFALDVRFAARLLRRNPIFTLTATLSLAIGIGATTAIFTVVNGLLLRPADGIASPATLVDIVRLETDGPGVSPFSYPDYLDVRREATTVEHVFAWQLILEPASLRAGESVGRVFPTLVSTNYFQALGVQPALGRTLGPADSDEPGASPVVVLSHRFWTRQFGADPAVTGRTIWIAGSPFTIVGVAAEGFRGTSVAAPDVWMPIGMIAAIEPEHAPRMIGTRQAEWLMLGGRLRHGVSRRQAAAEMAAIGATLEREFAPERPAPPGAREKRSTQAWSAELASPIPHGLRLIAAGFLAVLMGLVSVVMVTACANVAGVLLARAAARRREIAVRVAAGAARRRLVRQFLTEATLLFLLGGVAGLALARVLTSLLVARLPEFAIPIAVSVPLDWRVAAFALALTFAAALLAGLAPAVHASRDDVVSALKDETPGSSERLWLRHGFVVAQVAGSLLLVVLTGVLMSALGNLQSPDRGFDAVGVDAVSIDLSMARYTETTGAPFVRDLLARVRAMPGVQLATIADRPPGAGGLTLGGVSVPGVAPPSGGQFHYLNWTLVESDYFRMLAVPLLEGREFTDADRQGAEPVVILGRQAAESFWPGESAIGRSILVHRGVPQAGGGSEAVRGPALQSTNPAAATASAAVPLRVVGVVEDVGPAGAPDMYVPLQQRYWSVMTILARRDGARELAADLRALVSSLNPELPVLAAGALENLHTGPVETQLRVAAAVAGSVGVVGLILAAIGIYGVTSYVVTRRTREIGIRLALGAGHSTVVVMVVRHGLTLVAAGATIGVLLAAAAVRLLAGRGFGPGVALTTPDIPAFAGAVLLFVVVGLIACCLPVRRAGRIQAMDALRYE
jgi:putative ABC transport system permease protein